MNKEMQWNSSCSEGKDDRRKEDAFYFLNSSTSKFGEICNSPIRL